MRKNRLEIRHFTDGVNNVSRADLIGDSELHQCINYESVEKGILVRRKNLEVYDEYLNSAISTAFDEIYYPFSEPFYPMTKPSDMTGEFILFVFGKDFGDDYLVKAFYKISAIEWKTVNLGLSNAGVEYIANSDVRFSIGKEMVVITDYNNNNIAHFVTVDEDGEFISGILGMPAPTNKPEITQIIDWKSSDWEENVTNDRLCEPGLIQCLYCAVTEDGAKSNPSGYSETLDMQWFKLDDVGSDERWVNQINIKNLTIPVVNDLIKERLKYFEVSFRAIRYSEGYVYKPFEFSQRFEIIDKENTSGTTGNNYTLTVESDPATNPSYENDVAPIAKCSKQIGGVIMLGCVKEKMKFPFEFDKYCRIDINNTNGKTFIDAVIRIRLWDKDSGEDDAILELDWNDFSSALLLINVNRHKLRIYDSDLTTPLSVVVINNSSPQNYFDIYVKIPQLQASSVHSVYFCFGGTGVSSVYRTALYGHWIRNVTDSFNNWSDQRVFKPRKATSEDCLVCSPMDEESWAGSDECPNKANTEMVGTLSNASWNSGGKIAKIPALNKSIGTDSIQITTADDGRIEFSGLGLTNLPDKNFIFGFIRYNGNDIETSYYYNMIMGSRHITGYFNLITIDGDGCWGLWTRDSTSGGTYKFRKFLNITPALLSSGNHTYFILLSLDKNGDGENVKASLFIYNCDNNTTSQEKKDIGHYLMWSEFRSVLFGDNISATVGNALSNIYYDQVGFIKNIYYDAENNDDINTVKNIANFMPAFETMIGYKYSNESHNNLIAFQDTEELEYKEHKNRIKYTELNGITFPDLYYRDFREEIEAIDECPSYLQMKYQETALIWTRNIRYRMLLEGTPLGWATLVDNVIEEFTQFGLMNYKTLQRYGDIYLWLCELGLARMDRNGTRVVNYFIDDNGKERKRFNIPLTNANNYIGFVCPIRKQYLLHLQDNYTYVYQIDGDYWQGRFQGLDMVAGIILTGGTDAENINLVLSSDYHIYKYPGSEYTLEDCEILTKKYNFDLAVFLKAKFGFETGFVGEYLVDGEGNPVVDGDGNQLVALLGGSKLEEIYSRVFNINYTNGYEENQFSDISTNIWQGIPSGKNRGNKIQLRIRNAIEIKDIILDYKR